MGWPDFWNWAFNMLENYYDLIKEFNLYALLLFKDCADERSCMDQGGLETNSSIGVICSTNEMFLCTRRRRKKIMKEKGFLSVKTFPKV